MSRTEDSIMAVHELDEQRRLWIEAFRHTRHDWLNDLQMILGYAQLGKYDKLKACVDILKQKLTEESRTAKLGSDRLVELLLTVRARPKKYAFELRIDEHFTMPGSTAEQAAETAVSRLLFAFEEAAQRGTQGDINELVCTFSNESGTGPSIKFAFLGAYSENVLRGAMDELRTSLSRTVPGFDLADRYRERSAEVILRLTVP